MVANGSYFQHREWLPAIGYQADQELSGEGERRTGAAGEPLYLRMHRIRSGEQRITVTVPGEPAQAGIDPRLLLLDVKAEDNLAKVTRDE